MNCNCSYYILFIKQKTGNKACPLNSLYWHFLERHRDRYEANPRLAFAYRNLNKMDIEQRQALLQHADNVLNNLEQL